MTEDTIHDLDTVSRLAAFHGLYITDGIPDLAPINWVHGFITALQFIHDYPESLPQIIEWLKAEGCPMHRTDEFASLLDVLATDR